ncbi:MAG: protein-L-isoaspartate(D-aspartate) O-methyltransferase [Gammaproteobacteria bacterium]|jgi:protein-L-isoaspartate(D-aspartate) O-methyltransferase
MTTNSAQAKFNMIAQQIRPWEVLDDHVLEVIDSIDRVNFVNEIHKGLAYADCQIPVCESSSMLPPIIEGRMLQALTIAKSDEALQIGTGSGFVTACLATLAKKVDSIDCNPIATEIAQKNIDRYGFKNVQIMTCTKGLHSPEQDYDVIAVTGAVAKIPDTYKHALKIGGRLFLVVGKLPIMQALLITRIGASEWQTESLFETVIPPLSQ